MGDHVGILDVHLLLFGLLFFGLKFVLAYCLLVFCCGVLLYLLYLLWLFLSAGFLFVWIALVAAAWVFGCCISLYYYVVGYTTRYLLGRKGKERGGLWLM